MLKPYWQRTPEEHQQYVRIARILDCNWRPVRALSVVIKEHPEDILADLDHRRESDPLCDQLFLSIKSLQASRHPGGDLTTGISGVSGLCNSILWERTKIRSPQRSVL
jgi:hypothetical protein